MDRVNAVRTGEIDILKYLAKLWALTNFTFACSPFLVTVVVFTLYTTIDPVNHVLDASKIFVSMSLFGLMRLPLTIFPWALTESIKLFVSLKRINKFLNAEVSAVYYPRKFRHDAYFLLKELSNSKTARPIAFPCMYLLSNCNPFLVLEFNAGLICLSIESLTKIVVK